MSAQDRPQEAIKFHKSYMVGALLSALFWTYLYFNNPFGEAPFADSNVLWNSVHCDYSVDGLG